MEKLVIRSAQMADASAVASIHVESWRDAYANILDSAFLAGPIETERLGHWATRFETPPKGQIVEVAEDQNGRIVGFVCALPDVDHRLGSFIDNLHVAPAMRGRRIGERLLRSAAGKLAAEARSSALHLCVFEANESAIQFYLRLGGKIVGRDVSRIAAAHQKPILCIHWSMLADLASANPATSQPDA